MKKNVKVILIAVIVALAVITAIVATVYLKGREEAPPGQVALVMNNEEHRIDLSGLKLSDVSGEITNGKGEVKQITGRGILLSEVMGTSDFSEITVIADDEYRASLTQDDTDNAWLLVSEGQARLIVFGDKNAKRDVKNVVRIEVK